jgi:hypothetical protein
MEVLNFIWGVGLIKGWLHGEAQQIINGRGARDGFYGPPLTHKYITYIHTIMDAKVDLLKCVTSRTKIGNILLRASLRSLWKNENWLKRQANVSKGCSKHWSSVIRGQTSGVAVGFLSSLGPVTCYHYPGYLQILSKPKLRGALKHSYAIGCSERRLTEYSFHRRNFLRKSYATCREKCHSAAPRTEKSDKPAQWTSCTTVLFLIHGRIPFMLFRHVHGPYMPGFDSRQAERPWGPFSLLYHIFMRFFPE